MLRGKDALSALWAALDEGRELPPPNSITIYDYAARNGQPRDTARNQLDAKVAAGKLESGLFYVKGRKGKIRHYWLPTGKKK